MPHRSPRNSGLFYAGQGECSCMQTGLILYKIKVEFEKAWDSRKTDTFRLPYSLLGMINLFATVWNLLYHHRKYPISQR